MKNVLFIFFLTFFCTTVFSQNKKFHRPDPQGITDFLAEKLELSNIQQEKIKEAVKKKADRFDKINSEYLKKEREIEKIKKEMESMAAEMEKLYESLPETIVPFLDDTQKNKFEEMRKPKKKKIIKGKKVESSNLSVVGSDDQAKKLEAATVVKQDKKQQEKQNPPEIDIFYP